MRPDKRGLQPRLGVAWRPVAGSSLVVRAGYGIYRNTSVYQSIATLLAQQPPLSTTLSVENSAANPLTLANGFVGAPGATLNTFAVDPDFRVGYAHNWQVSMQRDLPAFADGDGDLSRHEGQPPDAGVPAQHVSRPAPPNPVPDVPVGIRLPDVERHARSRHAGQFQVRRRLRNGLTATVQYTLSKATDDAAAFAARA